MISSRTLELGEISVEEVIFDKGREELRSIINRRHPKHEDTINLLLW